ncbi:MAG TPA: NAD(P)/FAD-dependent oxidoreductase, partial [Polyangiaceae bacterium]
AEFVRYADALRARGDYFTHNTGEYHNGLAGILGLESKLAAAFDNGFRRDEVQRLYGHVYAMLFERITGEDGLGTRKTVLDELNLTSMFAFKEIGSESLERLLTRAGMRLASALKKEFPDAGVEKVMLTRNNGEKSHATVFGKEGARLEAIDARASELWNARGDSIAMLRL